MLASPEVTPYDLRWTMFGIRIRVHPLFWVMAAILGWSSLHSGEGNGFVYLLVWIACVFASVLLHELGHVWMGQVWGARGHIVLWSFGGLAIGASELNGRARRIAVYAAGPAIQLALWGVLYLLPAPNWFTQPYLSRAWIFLWMINLYWPLFNLLPIFPLDGGQITRELAGYVSPRKGTFIALQISTALCALIAVYGILLRMAYRPELDPLGFGSRQGLFFAIMFGLLFISNLQLMQAEKQRHSWVDERTPWDDPNW